MDMEHTNMKKT